MNGRPVKRISAYCGAAENGYSEGVYALCDDNTLWAFDRCGGKEVGWTQLPPIPQPEPSDA